MHLIMPDRLKASEAEQAGAAARVCTCFALRRASRLVTQVYDDALRPAGIRSTQLSLLLAARVFEPIPVSRLARIMATDRTTISRNLRPLEADGLIRVSEGEDRRVREVTLTRKGQRTVAQALPLWERAQRRMREELGDQRLQRLLSDLAAAGSVGQPGAEADIHLKQTSRKRGR